MTAHKKLIEDAGDTMEPESSPPCMTGYGGACCA
jgi:hypothetical protein